MEKFAIDLDRVLDEFELNEDLQSVAYQKSVITRPDYRLFDSGPKPSNDNVPCIQSSPSIIQQPDVASAEISPLDLSEADFAHTDALSPTLLVPQSLVTEVKEPQPFNFNCFRPIAEEVDSLMTVNSLQNDRNSEKEIDKIEEVNLLIDDLVIGDKLVSGNNSLAASNHNQEFSIIDSIKPLHYDETINKDYLITFGRKRDPSANKVLISTDNDHLLDSNDIGDRIEADGSSQSNVEEIIRFTPSAETVVSETSEPDETYTTPDDGTNMNLLTSVIEPANFMKDIDVSDDEMQRYLETDLHSEDLKLAFEDFYTPVTDTVLRENNLLGFDNEEIIIESEIATEVANQILEITETTQDQPLTFTGDVQNEVPELSIYDLHADRSQLVDEYEDEDIGCEKEKIARPTSLSLHSKIQEPTAKPPTPDANELDSAMDDGEVNAFTSLTATAGSPDAGLGLSPDDELEESLDLLQSGSELLLTEEEKRIGKVAPVWVPDAEALNCMHCAIKFTVIRRRHHCRACGRVFCGNCCGLKAKMTYMDNKEARVCQICLDVISKVQQMEEVAIATSSSFRTDHDGGSSSEFSEPYLVPRGPNPNNPSEYCSLIPPLQQATPNLPPPTVMVPVGVLKRETDGSKSKGEPKQVMFSDGIRPGGDLTELDGPDQRPPYRRQGRTQRRVERQAGSPESVVEGLPKQNQEYSLSDYLDSEQLLSALRDETAEPLVFVISRNLKVLVKIIDFSCCIKRTCWCIISRGMSAVGQDEIIVLLEFFPDEQSLPVDVFYHLIDVYEDASKGSPVTHMGHSVSSRPLFGAKDDAGFLYVRPTFQCLKKIPLPPPPFLFAILLQKWEIPWAKVFPLRLLLRLGDEFRYYPCPLFGVRFRTPVFFEIGHTVVNLLADFRNYQYSLPSVPGLVIHMTDGKTTINFPKNRYDEVVKALNTGIDHVLALAATFSTEADSHLVCIQNDQGNYQSQAISRDDKQRIVTGASFVVFNGALKSSSGLTAKSSIVEDGVMVHIPSDSMAALRQTLKDMKDYVVACGPIGAEKPDEIVQIQWIDDDKSVNVGVRSAIDGKPLDGVTSIRVHRGMDYVGDRFIIRWTEVYLIKNDTALTSRSCDPTDVSKVSDTLAQACCLALAPHLSSLFSNSIVKIGLRITLSTDNVGYEIGANEKVLPSCYMNDLDSELVPAIHSAASFHQEGSLVLELVFHVLQQ